MQKDPYRKLVAFIDEYGDSGLNFDNAKTSSHFVITAIIFEHEDLKKAKDKLSEIRDKYFQGSEIKSSSVKRKQTERRCKILKKLMEIDFTVFALVIDKQALRSKGFQYHKSFFKFCNKLIYDELYSSFPNLDIVADSHGCGAFIKSFKYYVQSKFQIPDLFNSSSFAISDSVDNDLIQIADFIGGTIAKGYDRIVMTEDYPSFLEILRGRISKIKEWPQNYGTYSYDFNSYCEFDNVIADYGVRAAEKYLMAGQFSSDPEEVDRQIVLRYLLFNFMHVCPDRYIGTNELRALLKRPISLQKFRSKIIAKLRDRDVLVVSSDKGYKLPMNQKDMLRFVKHSSNLINPLVERVLKARRKVLLITENAVDILSCEGNTNLRKLVSENY